MDAVVAENESKIEALRRQGAALNPLVWLQLQMDVLMRVGFNAQRTLRIHLDTQKELGKALDAASKRASESRLHLPA